MLVFNVLVGLRLTEREYHSRTFSPEIQCSIKDYSPPPSSFGSNMASSKLLELAYYRHNWPKTVIAVDLTHQIQVGSNIVQWAQKRKKERRKKWTWQKILNTDLCCQYESSNPLWGLCCSHYKLNTILGNPRKEAGPQDWNLKVSVFLKETHDVYLMIVHSKTVSFGKL